MSSRGNDLTGDEELTRFVQEIRRFGQEIRRAGEFF
jgi:hypothetical protein